MWEPHQPESVALVAENLWIMWLQGLVRLLCVQLSITFFILQLTFNKVKMIDSY